MKTIATVGLLLSFIAIGPASKAQTKKPKHAKERTLIACPEPDHYVEVSWKKLIPPEKACKTRPNVQPTASDLIWVFGKLEIQGETQKH